MNIRVVAVGKLKDAHFAVGVAEYVKRLGAYARTDVVEVRETPYHDPLSDGQKLAVMAKEAEEIRRRLSGKEYVIALDRIGKSLTSPELAAELDRLATQGRGNVAFLIGGSIGLAPELLQSADFVWSLSELTLPHGLARLVVVEQIYRAFTILRGERYHK